jgi:hypothetical protein
MPFPGLTYVNTSKTFTDKLWEEISAGKSVNDAVNSALSHTKSTHWFTHMFGWGDDTIVSPKLYSKTATSSLLVNNDDNKILPYIPSSASLSLTNSESLASFQKIIPQELLILIMLLLLLDSKMECQLINIM